MQPHGNRRVLRRIYLWIPVVLIAAIVVAASTSHVVGSHRREATRTTMTASDTPFNRVRTTQKMVALTFDDGPDPMITPKVLEILRETGARATFFTTGMHAEQYPDLVRQTMLSGEIANHSYNHPRLSLLERKKVAAQLATTQTILQAITGYSPRWVRPPYGKMSKAIESEAKALGLPVVVWDTAVDKYNRLPIDVAAKKLLAKLRPGSILLAHDACPPKDRESWCVTQRLRSLKILRAVFRVLHARGWHLVTISDLAAAAS